MRAYLLYFLLFISIAGNVSAQTRVDTLRNFPATMSMHAPKYTTNGWGYMLGQNHLYRQQFAEKYYIKGPAKVLGVVAHLAGKYTHPDNYVEFNLYNVGGNRLPNQRLAGVERLYSQLDLSGNAYYVQFLTPVTVADSFYVTFNVLDYLHGGYEGDTLGLYTGMPGSRSTEDLQRFGRNVVQAHNHSKEDWKDFYTQNFSPIATHFAIFPVVQFENRTTAIGGIREAYDLTIYPQPASGQLYYKLGTKEALGFNQVSLFNLQGQIVYRNNATTFVSSEPQKLDISHLQKGVYVLKLQNNQQVISRKIVVQ